MPLEYIEDAVIEWLEEASMHNILLDGLADDEHQEQVEAWYDAHDKKRKESVYG